jgi:hypothetical protein
MPVLDFSAQVPIGVGITQQDIFGDSGIWDDDDVNPSGTYGSFCGESDDQSLRGSGWSSPTNSEVMSVSDLCLSDGLLASR